MTVLGHFVFCSTDGIGYGFMKGGGGGGGGGQIITVVEKSFIYKWYFGTWEPAKVHGCIDDDHSEMFECLLMAV